MKKTLKRTWLGWKTVSDRDLNAENSDDFNNDADVIVRVLQEENADNDIIDGIG